MERPLAALREQLARRDEVLRARAHRVGWKLGMGQRERFDGSIAVGHLTSATCYDDGASVALTDSGALHATSRSASSSSGRSSRTTTSGLSARQSAGGSSLEIVDLAPVLDTPVAVIVANVFHRGVAFSPPSLALPAGLLRCAAYVN